MLLPQSVEIKNVSVYIFRIIIFSLGIRVVLSIFKAAAIRQGEADDDEYRFSQLNRWEAFWASFWSSGHHRNLDDYWLPAFIGAIELFIYPILMIENHWTFISAWLGIKTAVQWRKWTAIRTPYNRFLFANLLVLSFSYFFLIKFVSKT